MQNITYKQKLTGRNVIKLLKSVDLNNQKNLIICSVVLSLGISGVVLGGSTFSISGTALAVVAGVILNLIFKEKNLKIFHHWREWSHLLK